MENLPEMKFSTINRTPVTATKMRELVKDTTHLVTADGEPVCIVMSVENYWAQQPLNPKPSRQPKMVRVGGVLYREVV